MSTPALVLENQPVCNVCYKKPQDAISLPCQHQFCRACIKNHIVNSVEAQKFQGFGCPACQEFVSKPIMAGSRPKEQWAEYLPTVTLSDNKPDLLSSEKDELKCAACKEAGLDNAATLWCQQCNDSYCPDCSASHRNFPATRSHIQVPIAYISPRDRSEEDLATCSQHRDSRVEFYCAACDLLICPSCAFVNHRRCEKVSTIKGATDVAKGDLSTKIKRVRKKSSECQAMLVDSTSRIRELQISRQRTEDNIKGFTDQLMDTISANRDNMLSNISYSFNTEETRLNQTKTKLREHIVELEGCEQGIENLLNTNSETKLLANLSKTQRQYNASFEKEIRPEELVPFQMEFEPNTSLLDVLDSSQLGEAVLERETREKQETARRDDKTENNSDEPRDLMKHIKSKAKEKKTTKQKVKFKKSKRSKRRGSEGNPVLPVPITPPLQEPKVDKIKVLQKHKTVSTDVLGDSLKSSPSSIIVLFVNGVMTTVVADHNNYSLKSFYVNMGLDRQSKMSMDSKPCHVAKLAAHTVVVTMTRLKRIAVIKVSPGLSLIDRIRTSKYYNCIAALAEDRLAVGTTLESNLSIDIIDLQGEILHSICSDPDDKLLFSEPKFMILSPSGNLLVSDRDIPYISCFTQAGKLVFKTGPKQTSDLEGTSGLFCSEDDQIYISDKTNNRILLMQDNGETITTFLTAEQGVEQPQGLFIDDLDQVYICQANSKISIFKEVEIIAPK
ncbi:E3 ubiquitin-protein ligase TRIM56 [Patella vulgata]|uniref:E3 ubiquitin-protein ligase TRIM56 n=1 Tax=Patella vulgata TaxID=6465 RepID=UPI0021804468|nr:E3 ubiquitin-protein ligase TRIM56 [Patella vulgata]